MGKRILTILLGIMLVVFSGGCAKQPPPDSQKRFTPHRFAEDAFVGRVSAFMVLMDCSSSMGDAAGSRTKMDLGKDFVYRMSLTLPQLDLEAVLRTFGHNPLVSLRNTRKLYDAPYEPGAFHIAVNKIGAPGGQSPLQLGLVAAERDLRNIRGDIALFIVSDGLVVNESAISAVKTLKQLFGERLCLYPVMTGNSKYGRTNMEALAEVGGCGFLATAETFLGRDDMGRYVGKVFLKEHPDADGDGIDDRFDQCPSTPPSAEVDSRGCWVIGSIEYAFGQWEIRPEYYPLLDKVYRILKRNPELKVEIQGHTDNTGDAGFNRELALNRAKAVKRYLVAQGIDASRLQAAGFGETRPIASNQTEAGREANRRVELKPLTGQVD